MPDFKAVLPVPTADSAAFWDGCNQGKLLLAHCGRCDHVFYYPRLACPRCGDRQLGWRESAGAGTVFSYSHVHVSFWGETWESELPYTIVLIDLDEGPRMLSRLVGDRRSEVRAGDRVMLEFHAVGTQKLPFFHLA